MPGEFHGWRSLAGYSPWGRKELDAAEVTQHICMHAGPKQGNPGTERQGPFWSERMRGAHPGALWRGLRGSPWTGPPTALLREAVSATSAYTLLLVWGPPLQTHSRLPAQVPASVLASPAPWCALFFLQGLVICLPLVDPSAAPSLYTFTLESELAHPAPSILCTFPATLVYWPSKWGPCLAPT